MKAERWIELEETFLSDVPRIWRGRKLGYGPDPNVPPTKYWLAGYECTRGKRGVRRKHWFETLHGKSASELDEQLAALVDRPDVVVIAEQRRPYYLSYRGESQPLDV